MMPTRITRHRLSRRSSLPPSALTSGSAPTSSASPRPHVADDPCGHPDDDRVIRYLPPADDGGTGYVAGDGRSGADERALAHRQSREDGGVAADRYTRFDHGSNDPPVCVRLERSVLGDGARIGIVDEHHTVADEHAVLDGHSLADERVARYLAIGSDGGAFLNLDE